MKKNFNVLLLSAFVFVMSTAFIVKDSTGKLSYAGAPGDSGNCGSCHGGGAGVTTVSISTSPTLDPGNTYTPGATYTINIKVTNSNFSSFGFDAEVINGTSASSGNSGTLSLPGTGVKFLTGGAPSRKNATHTTPKAGTGNANFTFVWTAPLSSTATAIYASGNAVNLNGSTTGDAIGVSVLIMSPSSATALKENELPISEINMYPNPASGKLTLNYHLKEGNDVVIDLYTITGQKAATLFSEKQSPGIQNVSVNIPAYVAPGVYFVKASAGGELMAQRLLTIM